MSTPNTQAALQDRHQARQTAQSSPTSADLLAVIRAVHAEYADDLCWLSIDRIFAAAGLPVPDRRVGDKEAMKRNCERFIDTMCAGGKWPSYVALEAEIARLRKELAQYE